MDKLQKWLGAERHDCVDKTDGASPARYEKALRLVEGLAKEVQYLEENVFHPAEFEHAGHEQRSQGRIQKAMERAGVK